MKNKLFVVLLAIVLAFSFKQIYAVEDILAVKDDINTKENMIKNKIDEFVKLKNKDSVYDLNNEEEIELTQNIQQYKNTLNSNEAIQYGSNPSRIYSSGEDIGGYIFATLESKTSGWNHGHAGIGYSAGGNVIEANPNVGVKLYGNRVNEYWGDLKSGGIYTVNGASSSQYVTAKNYAYSKLGCGYNLNPFNTNTFYCSELVYYAWDAAGVNIASSRVWGTLILPSQIMNDGDTVLRASFPLK